MKQWHEEIKVLPYALLYSLCSRVHQSVVMCLCIFIMFLCSSKCCHVPMYIHYAPVFIKVLSCAYAYSLCSCVYQSVVMCLCIFIMFLCLSKCYHMPMYINCVPVFIMPIYRLMVNFQHYISYMVAVSFIGGGNQRTWSKPLTGCKSLTD